VEIQLTVKVMTLVLHQFFTLKKGVSLKKNDANGCAEISNGCFDFRALHKEMIVFLYK